MQTTRLPSFRILLTAVASVAISACTVPGAPSAEPSPAPEGEEPAAAPSPETSSGEDNYESIYVGFSDDGSGICGGDLAEDTFRYGLCICNDLDMAGSLRTASVSGGSPDLVAGGVGVNGNYALAGSAEIDGSLVVGGRFSPAGRQVIGSELRVGGNVNAAGSIDVGGDAYLAGRVSAIGLDISGTLYTQEEQSLFFIDAADNEVMPFDIPPPCACGETDEVAGFVADAASNNDNAAQGIDPGVLDNVAGDHTLEVGPGRVYLTDIQVAGVLTFVVTGSTAVYIDGDLQAAGLVDVEFASDDAELNLFIDGSIRTAGQLELGTDGDVSKVRVYMSGNGDISLAGGLAIRGGLSAPLSDIRTAGDVILEGAIVVGRLHSAGVVDVNYDTGFIAPDGDCVDDGEPEEPAPEAQPEEPAPEDEPAPEGQPEEPAPEEPAPEGQPEEPAPEDEPAPEAQPEPSDDDVPCATSLDCVDPQICIGGTCGYASL